MSNLQDRPPTNTAENDDSNTIDLRPNILHSFLGGHKLHFHHGFRKSQESSEQFDPVRSQSRSTESSKWYGAQDVSWEMIAND